VAPEVELYNDDGQRSIVEALDFAARLAPSLRSHVATHDLVVVSVFPYFPVLTAKLCTLLTDTPLVTTWHEVWGDYWDDYLGSLAPGGKIVEQVTAKTPQHPVAVSGVTAEKLAEIGPRRDRIDVIPNGINLTQIRDAPLPTESFRRDGQPGFDVLFVGRLIEDKRVDVLLDAFDRVAATYDATLGVIGDGPQASALRAQAQGLDHADRVRFLGFLDDSEDVLGHMRAARVFASVSTREGFGITYAEAMAAGCIVIAADHRSSAASEVVGDAGYLVTPVVDDVANALDDALAGNRPTVDPMTRARQFDWDKIARQAESTYRRVVNEK
jgi:glycosyltransferase involved in cell wall biosynthesis